MSGSNNINGTPGNDTLTGDNDTLVPISFNDQIDGQGGNDTLIGLTGNDTLLGGADNDLMAGGSGNDSIDGGNAGGGTSDTLFGGAGNDTLDGNVGNDAIEGGSGNDSILGGDGNDTIGDILGSATIDGNQSGAEAISGADTVLGGNGNDFVTTGTGNDSILGDVGNDTINGGDGANTLLGGTESDSIASGAGNDSIDGGTGDDTFNAGGGGDTISDVSGSNVTFGEGGNDRLTVSNNGTQFYDGGTGSDIVRIGLGQGQANNIVAANGIININGQSYNYTHSFVANGFNVYMRNVEFIEFNGGVLVPVCFYPGTQILTPIGEVTVETLRIGDPVLTSLGQIAPIRWIGRQTLSTRFADPLRALPIRIRAGALGDGLPSRDLLVSPSHAMLVDGVLIQAGALVNGCSILREADIPESFTYYHIELVDHTLILAEGAPAETFVDHVTRENFDNWAEHEALYGDAPVREMDLPRAKSHRQVPMATRRRLAALATSLYGMADTAAA